MRSLSSGRLLVIALILLAVGAVSARLAVENRLLRDRAARAGDITAELREEIETGRIQRAQLIERLRAQRQRRARAQARLDQMQKRLTRSKTKLDRLAGLFAGQLPLTGEGPCAENILKAASRGLSLPSGWDLRCPGPGLDWDGRSHWGVTCPYDRCPEGVGPYLSISNPTYYVVTHELCHAAFGYGVGAGELQADRCAARYGADLSTSPYG